MFSSIYSYFSKSNQCEADQEQPQQQTQRRSEASSVKINVVVQDDESNVDTLDITEARVCPTISFFPFHDRVSPKNSQNSSKHPCRKWPLDWRVCRGLTTDTMANKFKSTAGYPLFQFLGQLRTRRVIISVLWALLMCYLNCVGSVIADSRSLQLANYDYSNPKYQQGGALQDLVHQLIAERQLGGLSDYWAAGYGLFVLVHLLARKDRSVSLTRFLWCVGVIYLFRAISLVLTTSPSPTSQCQVQEHLTNLGFWGMFGPNIAKNIWFQGHTSFLQLCGHFFALYTDYNWKVKWFSWLVAYTGSFLLLIQRWHYTDDVLVGVMVTAGVVFGYHAAVWSYHAYLKVGQMGFQWSNPFTVFMRLIWWMDGLDYSLLEISNNDPIIPTNQQK